MNEAAQFHFLEYLFQILLQCVFSVLCLIAEIGADILHSAWS
jgi:hypothetical protein